MPPGSKTPLPGKRVRAADVARGTSSQGQARTSLSRAGRRIQRGTTRVIRNDRIGPATAASERPFLVAGVGASAGGLEAFTQLLKALPGNTGMAFVLVQHLAPKHESLLSELLSRATKIPVCQATEAIAVKQNCVYVIPPNVDMAIREGRLRLMPRGEGHGPHLPIDGFFRSLAEDCQDRSVGIILSGTASDGALGMAAIKEVGGITLAQEERSAKYPSMPHSAIASGVVDFVLSPERIAQELARIGKHFGLRTKAEHVEESPVDGEGAHRTILQIVGDATGVDFSHYKQDTVRRRIQRRMILHRVERPQDYVTYLRSNPDEVRSLYEDVLVNVTGFFRDPEMFEALANVVYPALRRECGGPIRIWVPGCSTGEEAYSIAISLLEYLGDQATSVPMQLFATDISGRAIETARTGIYRETLTAEISAERLRRYFVRVEGGFQISKAVRDLCIFARQNLTRDPPFSRLDLVSCRNVLIYLSPVVQKQVMPILHYALNPGRFLMLGSSESVVGFPDLFDLVERKHRIYARKEMPVRTSFEFPAPDAAPPEQIGTSSAEGARRELDLARDVDRLLLARYAPAGVLVNEELEIIQFRGRTGRFLEPSPGLASVNLMRMAREGLAAALRDAVRKAGKARRSVRRNGVPYLCEGERRIANIEVCPVSLAVRPTDENYYLIMFDRVQRTERPSGKAKGPPAARWTERAEVGRLRRELGDTKAYLQSIIEELEATNEELKSANEEILSSNEELQSTNEEMETAKEELQSGNEELTTVNEELVNRNVELGQVNSDLTNVLASVNLPIVILGSDLRIRRFTPASEKTLNLIPGDTGRRVTDIKPNLVVPGLEKMLLEVIDTVSVRETTVQDMEGRWYSLRARPYRTIDNRIDGAVMMLLDIDELRRNVQELQETREYARAIVETVQEAFLVLSHEFRVQSANRAFYELFQMTPETTIGRFIFELGDGSLNVPHFLGALKAVAGGNDAIEGLEFEAGFPVIGRRTLQATVRRIEADSLPGSLLCAVTDITELLRAKRAVGELAGRLLRLRDEEQRRIARELHDATAQNLTAIAMNLELVTNAPAGLVPDSRRLLLECQDLAEQCSRELRDISSLLHPPLLDDIGLVEAIKWHADSFTRRTGVKVTLHKPKMTGRLPREIETALFRIVQESLSNVHRHSGSEVAEIRIRQGNGEISVQVSDRGHGFPATAGAKRLGGPTLGVGLPGMRERTNQLGGHFSIKSGEHGTTLHVRLPIPTVEA